MYMCSYSDQQLLFTFLESKYMYLHRQCSQAFITCIHTDNFLKHLELCVHVYMYM